MFFWAKPKSSNHFSTMAVTCHLKQPTRKETEAGRLRPLFQADSFLFGLAPDGVYQARPVTRLLVSSTSPFHPYQQTGACWRSIFCGTFPNLTAGGCYPPSHPPEPGLSSRQNLIGTKNAVLPRKMKMLVSQSKSVSDQRLPGPLRFLQNRRTAHGEEQAVRAGLGCEVRNQTQAAGKWCKTWRGNMQDSLFIV